MVVSPGRQTRAVPSDRTITRPSCVHSTSVALGTSRAGIPGRCCQPPVRVSSSQRSSRCGRVPREADDGVPAVRRAADVGEREAAPARPVESSVRAGAHVVQDERRAGPGAAQDEVAHDRPRVGIGEAPYVAVSLDHRAVGVAAERAGRADEESGRQVGDQAEPATDQDRRAARPPGEVDLGEQAAVRATPAPLQEPGAAPILRRHRLERRGQPGGGGRPVPEDVDADVAAAGAEAVGEKERVLPDGGDADAPVAAGRQAGDARGCPVVHVEHERRRSVRDEEAKAGLGLDGRAGPARRRRLGDRRGPVRPLLPERRPDGRRGDDEGGGEHEAAPRRCEQTAPVPRSGRVDHLRGYAARRLRGSVQRSASTAATSSRLARLWPLAKTSTWGSAACMPRASGS